MRFLASYTRSPTTKSISEHVGKSPPVAVLEAMTLPDYQVRPMAMDDYAGVMELLGRVEGVCLRDADSYEGIAQYLERNPGMSFVAEAGGHIGACVFGGHDGRRGYLYHLAVGPELRRRGVGRVLVEHAMTAIRAEGIEKFHIDVLAGNDGGLCFWQAIGWHERSEIKRLSCVPGGRSNC
jgi:N-acetylglutamate synthase